MKTFPPKTIDNVSPIRNKIVEGTFYFCFISFLVIIFYTYACMNGLWHRSWEWWTVIYYAKTVIEMVVTIFSIFYLLVGLCYRKPVQSPQMEDLNNGHPNIAVVYLCCDDLNRLAFKSILVSCIQYDIQVWVHDDSTNDATRAEVDRVVEEFMTYYGRSIRILRRADRAGGKPSAINNVVQNLGSGVEFILLCDSDTFLPSNHFLKSALVYFQDPQVAIVQFRNIGHVFAEDGFGYRILFRVYRFLRCFCKFHESIWMGAISRA